MTAPNENGRSVERRTYGAIAGWLATWPDWLLVVAFLGLAVSFALAGKLDDWLRGVVALGFLAVAFALVARFRIVRTEKHEPPSS